MNNKNTDKQNDLVVPAELNTSVDGPGSEDTSRIHISANARGVALSIIASVAFVFALSAAHKFFIPLVFGIFIAYTLNPLVVRLERIRIPRVVGTVLVISAILSSALWTANNLRDEFNSILVSLPTATQKLQNRSSLMLSWQE